MKKGVSARGGAGLKGLTAVAEDVPKIRPTYSQTEYHGKVWGITMGGLGTEKAECPTRPWIMLTTP